MERGIERHRGKESEGVSKDIQTSMYICGENRKVAERYVEIEGNDRDTQGERQRDIERDSETERGGESCLT